MCKLPGPLRLTPSFPFAGRTRELATLRALIPRANGEGLRFALIGGEAGSGKSRLVHEFAQGAAAGGALVLYGACDSVVRRPYGPFVEAHRPARAQHRPGTLPADLGAEADELARLLPDMAERFGELAASDRGAIRIPSATACMARWRDLLAAAGRSARCSSS